MFEEQGIRFEEWILEIHEYQWLSMRNEARTGLADPALCLVDVLSFVCVYVFITCYMLYSMYTYIMYRMQLV